MKRSFFPVLLVAFAIGNVLCQNADELPIPVETDNQFPPEYSESDSYNEDSKSTAENTQPMPISTTDVPVSSLADEDGQVFDEGSETTAVESIQTTSASIISDVATAATSTTTDDQDNENANSETTMEKIQRTSGSTITDVAAEASETTPASLTAGIDAPGLTSDDEVLNKGSESMPEEPTPTSPGSTTVDVVASIPGNDDVIITNKEGETTAEEPTKTTSDSTIEVPAPTLTNDDEQTTMEKIQRTSESTITDVAAEASETTPASSTAGIDAPGRTSDDKVLNKGSEIMAEVPTPTSPGSTTVDVVSSIPGNDDVIITNKEGETTAEEPTKTTSDSTIEVPAPTLTNDDEQVTNNQGSETTATESITTISESTIAPFDASELANDNDQVTVNEGSETTVDTIKLTSKELPCPGPCICITEADLSNYIVDCSDCELTDFPTPIDPKTTTLKLQNNQLTVIPKGISELKNLINLNANDNLISELEFGSISELPKLVSLKLANNRFLEYPKELENASNLDKLEELDLGGNEMKTVPEIFLNFKALRTVTLAEDSPELVSQLCNSLKETLGTVCTKSCTEHSYLCSDIFEHSKDDSLDATLPGIIPFFHEIVKEDTKNLDDSLANSVNSDTTKTSNSDALEAPYRLTTKETADIMPLPSSNSRRKDSSEMPMPPPEPKVPKMSSATKENLPASDFSLRTAVDSAPQEKVALGNTLIETPKDTSNNEADVKIGAKTTETKASGVDKSVIAVVVAGMIIIVAVIAIKKNWSSIRKRFSSAPRPNDRNVNGTTVTPEEVPLQDKSPA